MHEMSNVGPGPRTPSDNIKGGSSHIFPSLLVTPSECQANNSRRNHRRRGRADTWKQVEVVWNYFNFLEGGSPYSRHDQVSLAKRCSMTVWTSKHSTYAGFLHDEIHKFGRLSENDSLGRGLEELNKMVSIIRNSQYSPGPYTVEELQSTARPVQPARMSLPEVAGIIDPVDHLKREHLESFLQMPQTVPHDVPPESPTKGCFKVNPEDVVEVYTKLLDSGVATLIPESQALRNSQGEIISGGLFAVPHKTDTDRIICDRRPMNELERRLIWAKLPHGCLLTQIILPKECSIRGSGDDLSNYFYLLRHRPEWIHRNCVGKVVSGRGFEKYGVDADKNYVLAFTVIPMGDLNAVDIAQQTHLEILKDSGCMQPHEVLSYGHPLPAEQCLEGLYIDDHITMQIVPKKKFGRTAKSRYRDNEIVEKSRARYDALGIPVSKKKAFNFQAEFQAWGTSVDSNSGRVGTPLVKLKQLSTLITKVCHLKVVSKKLLQKVLGLFVHPCMHQRLLMCILQESYLWVEKLCENKPKKLPVAVREELLTLGMLLPLCHSNIRWPVSNRISATDASLSGGGRAATLTTPSISQTMYRYSVHKGEAVRLDWIHGGLSPPTELSAAPQQLEDLMQAHVWNTTGRCKFGHKQHINLLEMKMLKAELVDLVQTSVEPSRIVVLVDSRVVAGAYSKGRSSSKQLNRILRSMLCWSLVGRKSLHLLWVQSSKNPSDHPSRGARIPEPKRDDPILKEIFGERVPSVQKRRSNRTLHQLAQIGVKDDLPSSSSFDSFVEEPSSLHPAQKDWQFREIFSGCGALTAVFRKKGMFKVGSPVELIQRNKPHPDHDLLNDNTYKRLLREARAPRQFWHFGLPCSSFSLMQNMNGGTRSSVQPEGDGTLEREETGNILAFRTIVLCKVLHAHGNFFTIENPLTSFVWKLHEMEDLLNQTHAQKIRFDQCAYGLKLPGEHGEWGAAKKPTILGGTLPGIEKLARVCQGDHAHIAVIGGVKVDGKWTRRSTLAGRYPLKLCQGYHSCCERLFNIN